MASAQVTLKLHTTEFDLVKAALQAYREDHHNISRDEEVPASARAAARAIVLNTTNLLKNLE